MACDTPVIASAIPSIVEELGDAGLYFDPTETENIVAALTTFRSSSAEVARLRARGAERVKQFTWEKVAMEHLRIYRKVSG
jgi:glycosyltransferase involved in cell wall biosynthesis